jgi:hypothetical protein
MSAGVPLHEIVPVPRGWLSENILAARLGEDFSLDIPFHRTGFIRADAILTKGHHSPNRCVFSLKQRDDREQKVEQILDQSEKPVQGILNRVP